MDYAELSTALQDWLQCDEETFVAHIPEFVKAAERRVYFAVDLPVQRSNAMGNTQPGIQYLPLPDDCLTIYDVFVVASGEYKALLRKETGFLREAYPNPNATGTPRYYAWLDKDDLALAPTPDGIYPVELHYFAMPPSIVDAGTSWLGEHHPRLLLTGALIEAYTFLKGEDDLLALYEKQFQDALAQMKANNGSRFRADEFRAGAVK